jgi:hypothetical protein
MKKILSGNFRVSQRYKGAVHRGIDLVAGMDKTVYAPTGGRIALAGWQNISNHNEGFGLRVWWQNGNKFFVVGHLDRIIAKVGDVIPEGQPLGTQGATGTSTGPHVHFEIRVGGTSPENSNIDPAAFLGIPNIEGNILQVSTPEEPPLTSPQARPNAIYQVSSVGRRHYYPDVIDTMDYAGSFGNHIDRVLISTTMGDIHYRVRANGRWLPEVRNRDDYAGIIGQPITDIAIRATEGRIRYRVHITEKGWLPWVSGYDIADVRSGYAGNGKPIDALQIEFV